MALAHAVRIGGTLFAPAPPDPDPVKSAELVLDLLGWWRLDSREGIDGMRKEMAALAFAAQISPKDSDGRLERRLRGVDMTSSLEVAGAFVDEVEAIVASVYGSIPARLATVIRSRREKQARP